MIKIIIPGQPRPKQRPRKGKFGNFYSPTSKAEGEVGLIIKAESRKRGFKPDPNKPLYVNYAFYYKPSRGRYPDEVNLQCFYNDAIEKSGLIKNDRKIKIKDSKYRINKHLKPRVEIEIWD